MDRREGEARISATGLRSAPQVAHEGPNFPEPSLGFHGRGGVRRVSAAETLHSEMRCGFLCRIISVLGRSRGFMEARGPHQNRCKGSFLGVWSSELLCKLTPFRGSHDVIQESRKNGNQSRGESPGAGLRSLTPRKQEAPLCHY